MTKRSQATITTIGIDIGKNSFHVIGFDERGTIVLRQKLSRGQIEVRFANLPRCLIGMEACVGSHHLSRRLQTLGHDVRIMPALYVKPYLKGQKNDYRDAEAISEAVQRPTMLFVQTKTLEQLDLQALHRLRTRLVRQRTAVINQIRAFLLERGFAVRQGLNPLRQALPNILAKPGDELSPRMIHMIEGLCDDWRHFDHRIDDLTGEIEALVKADDNCQRLMTIPGVGPLTASAMVSAVGDGAAFQRGRDFGAWLGLVPRQMSTGDRTILGAISKRGNKHLRTLFIQGAWVVLMRSKNWHKYSFGNWLEVASKRLHRCVLVVALANKLARIAWSVLNRGRAYDASL